MFGNFRDVLRRGLGALIIAILAIATIGCNSTPAPAAPAKPPPGHQAKLPTPESGNYKQLCTDKSNKRGVLNSEMFYDCMTHLAEADRTLTDLVTKYSSFPWMQAIVDAASRK